MKLAVLCLFAIVAVVCVSARPGEKYTDKFDNIDVDKILRSDRLLQNYYKCLMEEGRCTPDGTELKKLLPDALETECEKCTQRQKDVTKKTIRFIVDNKPEMWKHLADKYDPDKKYRSKYEKEGKQYGIDV